MKGKPQRRPNTTPEYWTVKWVQSPSRVPGCRNDSRRSSRTLVSDTGPLPTAAPSGALRRTTSTSSATPTPTAAAPP